MKHYGFKKKTQKRPINKSAFSKKLLKLWVWRHSNLRKQNKPNQDCLAYFKTVLLNKQQ